MELSGEEGTRMGSGGKSSAASVLLYSLHPLPSFL